MSRSCFLRLRLIFGFVVLVFPLASDGQPSGSKLAPEVFYDKLKNSQAAVIDVRTAEEFANGYIANAVNIDYNSKDFQRKIDQLDKSRAYYLYCLSGGRSNSALDYMMSHGFTKVYELKGGILKWKYPLVQTASTETGMSVETYNKLAGAGDLVVVDFYGPWCGPCKKMEPMFEEISSSYSSKLKVVRINVDKNGELIKTLGIEEIPVIKIFRRGKETWSHTGLIEKSALIDALGI